MVNVLIVDDSPTVCYVLQTILESDPDIKVVGFANNGHEAVQKTKDLQPDLITMDVLMPGMDGIEATRLIMSQRPTPIIVISAHNNDPTLEISFNALQAGALQVVDKPENARLSADTASRASLIATVKLMSEVRVVRRRFGVLQRTAVQNESPQAPPPSAITPNTVDIVAIGASTGGPAALNTLLSALPADFSTPILIVQHITTGFTQGLASWLQHNCQLSVVVAQSNQRIQPGTVYIAPDDRHLYVDQSGHLRLNHGLLVNHVRPSIDILFESIGVHYGGNAVGVLLTGMGEDGARGLLTIRRHGGFTIAQDEASSVVYGMPKAAVELGACSTILPLDEIASVLVRAGARRRAF
jgi:two-component system chemotaxis response regulator CheB